MWKKLFRPYAAAITLVVFTLIGILSLVSVNFHFLDPFNQSLQDYDITDIVYSRLRNTQKHIDERIVIVNTGQPSRERLAAMLERIIAAQPQAIGVDVLFDGRKERQSDSLLQAALKKSDRLVLACTLKHYREDLGYFQAADGLDTLFSHYAHIGYANFPSLPTKTIRFFSPQEKTAAGPVLGFATEIARQYDPEAANRLLKRSKALERIHFTSTEDYFIQFEPENILDTAIDLRPLLQGKIVLLGYNSTYSDECPLLDKFYTPLNEHYTGRSEPDMYGITIHANIIQMILDDKYIYKVPDWLSFLIAIWFCYANITLWERIYRRFPEFYHPIMRILQVLEFTLLFFIISFLFYALRIKWDFAAGLLALVLYFDVLLSYEAFFRNRGPWVLRLPRAWRTNPGE
jgi:CHASE2 domain-containing sensor protein